MPLINHYIGLGGETVYSLCCESRDVSLNAFTSSKWWLPNRLTTSTAAGTIHFIFDKQKVCLKRTRHTRKVYMVLKSVNFMQNFLFRGLHARKVYRILKSICFMQNFFLKGLHVRKVDRILKSVPLMQNFILRGFFILSWWVLPCDTIWVEPDNCCWPSYFDAVENKCPSHILSWSFSDMFQIKLVGSCSPVSHQGSLSVQGASHCIMKGVTALLKGHWTEEAAWIKKPIHTAVFHSISYPVC